MSILASEVWFLLSWAVIMSKECCNSSFCKFLLFSEPEPLLLLLFILLSNLLSEPERVLLREDFDLFDLLLLLRSLDRPLTGNVACTAELDLLWDTTCLVWLSTYFLDFFGLKLVSICLCETSLVNFDVLFPVPDVPWCEVLWYLLPNWLPSLLLLILFIGLWSYLSCSVLAPWRDNLFSLKDLLFFCWLFAKLAVLAVASFSTLSASCLF